MGASPSVSGRGERGGGTVNPQRARVYVFDKQQAAEFGSEGKKGREREGKEKKMLQRVLVGVLGLATCAVMMCAYVDYSHNLQYHTDRLERHRLLLLSPVCTDQTLRAAIGDDVTNCKRAELELNDTSPHVRALAAALEHLFVCHDYDGTDHCLRVGHALNAMSLQVLCVLAVFTLSLIWMLLHKWQHDRTARATTVLPSDSHNRGQSAWFLDKFQPVYAQRCDTDSLHCKAD